MSEEVPEISDDQKFTDYVGLLTDLDVSYHDLQKNSRYAGRFKHTLLSPQIKDPKDPRYGKQRQPKIKLPEVVDPKDPGQQQEVPTPLMDIKFTITDLDSVSTAPLSPATKDPKDL